jgi:LDH2 family malate/lactate/ureidoglycolate dehydrogenase
MRFDAAALGAWAIDVAEAVGWSRVDAEEIVGNLLWADRRGIASHGLVRLPVYVQRAQAGGIDPRAVPEVSERTPGVALVDGRHAAGQVSAAAAVHEAAERARRLGIGAAWVRNGNHFGAAGYYGECLARDGFAGYVMCSTDAVMSPPGGTRATVGTNPICLFAPPAAPDQPVPMVDMATSAVAYGKVIVASRQGTRIPLGWGVDAKGRDTDDPRAVLDGGTILGVGGYKGFGLSFMIDVIGGAVGGASTGPRIGAYLGDAATPQRLSHVIIAAAVGTIDPDGAYAARLATLAEDVHANPRSPVAAGNPMIPGEPEWRASRRDPAGVTVDDRTAADLEELGRTLGCAPMPKGRDE